MLKEWIFKSMLLKLKKTMKYFIGRKIKQHICEGSTEQCMKQ